MPVWNEYAIQSGAASKQIIKENINATPLTNINSGAATVYAVKIDASQNGGEDVYLRFYGDTVAAPTVGTDAAEMVLWGKAGDANNVYLFPEGVAFATGLGVACVKTAGGTAGSDSPSGQVDVVILLT